MSDFQSIKYRLIGAAVIVISFVFSCWLLLDHEVHRLQDIQADIPKPMEIERFTIDKPQDPAIKQQDATQAVAESAVIAERKESSESQPAVNNKVDSDPRKSVAKTHQKTTAVETHTPALSALDKQGLPEAWVLQVASFQDKTNAQQLQSKLVANAFPAYVKMFSLAEGKSYRVLVGPKLNKIKADELAKKKKKQQGLKSLIMKYKPGLEE